MAREKGDLADRLDEHLGKRGEADRKWEEEERKALEALKRFAETFRAICAEKIVPILEKARTPFENRGLKSNIVEQYDGNPPLIYLEVELRGRSLLIYTAFRKASEIRVSRGYDYYDGSGDEIRRIGLNDITPEIVQSQVNEFLEAGIE